MKNLLMTDRAWPQMIEVVTELSDLLKENGIKIYFLTSNYPSKISSNLEIINLKDIPQKKSLQELQNTYSFSIIKTLVTERSFYDYSSFRKSQIYGRLSKSKIDDWVELYANAFDYLLREKIDILIENAPDCFIPSLGGNIAKFYKKEYFSIYILYWWSKGVFFFDQLNWTSTEIDKKYELYYKNPELIDILKIQEVFKEKKSYYQIPNHNLFLRLKQLINRENSYESISLLNLVNRRISGLISK
jgi:hypothetical protein